MLREGEPEEWAALAREMDEKHRRKSGFMSAFDRLGEEQRREPSFLDRARARWTAESGRRRAGR